MKYLLDTNVYIRAVRSKEQLDSYRTAFFPLLPFTYLSAVVAYELSVNAVGSQSRRLVQGFIAPLERAGRLVSPNFSDWIEAAEIVTAIERNERQWKSKLPVLLNDVLIALCARSIGAMLVTYNGADFRLIRRHEEFRLRVLENDA